MIHIVFQEADIEVLKKSFDLDAALTGDVIQIKDDYAVGPLGDLYTSEGKAVRKAWWRKVLAGGDYNGLADDGTIDDHATAEALVDRMRSNPGEVIWIWAAQNKHDVSGYYWLLHFLHEFRDRIHLLYLNNLPFINEKGGIFYPVNLFDIPPREFVKAKKLARIIHQNEFELDMEEWKRLCSENKGVRILDSGKKLLQYDEDYYDASLLQFIGAEWQKAGRLMFQFLGRAKHTTGDAYLLWRLKELIATGKVACQGEMKHMKDFEVRISAEAMIES